MRGDYVVVTLQMGSASTEKKVQAKTVGAEVSWARPSRSDQFMEVAVTGRNNEILEKALFAVPAILSVEEGHETLGSAKVRVVAKKP